jgi:hypothetical protein
MQLLLVRNHPEITKAKSLAAALRRLANVMYSDWPWLPFGFRMLGPLLEMGKQHRSLPYWEEMSSG